MAGKTLHPVLGAAAAALAAALAVLQPPRPIPPVDQFGAAAGQAGELAFPGDPATSWILREPEPAWELRLEGSLAEAGPDRVRIRQEGGGEAELRVGPETSWYLDGEPVTQDRIPEGAEVRAVFDLAGEERIARRIDAGGPGEAAPGPETFAPPVSIELPGAAADEGARGGR